MILTINKNNLFIALHWYIANITKIGPYFSIFWHTESSYFITGQCKTVYFILAGSLLDYTAAVDAFTNSIKTLPHNLTALEPKEFVSN